MQAAETTLSVSVTGPSNGLQALHGALTDLRGGLSDWRVWTFLAHHDIRARYRRSTLGPLWLTLSMAIQISAMGVVWATLFNMEIRTFIPYLSLGMLIWSFITSVVGEGSLCFVSSAGYITQTKRPLTTYVFQLVFKNLLIAGHTFLVYLVTAIVFQITPTPAMLLAVPGVVLFVLALAWAPLFLGPIGARFRDIPQVIQSILMVVFFITPVMWKPDMLGERALIAILNPLTHLVAIVRLPLLGEAPSTLNWTVALLTAAVGWTLAIGSFVRVRTRIPYWV